MIHFSASKNLGEPIWAVQPQDACFGVENGENMMYTTTSGIQAVFNVYNLDRKELVFSKKIPPLAKVWRHNIDSHGRVYMAEKECLYRYDPEKRNIEMLGRFSNTEIYSFVATIDTDDKLYFGTYPNAKVIQYDPDTGIFTDLGQADPKASYVRSIAVHNGYIYAGTFGTPPGRLVRIRIDNPEEKTIFEIPANPTHYDVSKIRFLYDMNMAGDLLVIYCPMGDERRMILFDTRTATFVEDYGLHDEYSGYVTSPLVDHRSYFMSKGRLWYLDTQTAKCVRTEIDLGEDLPFYGCGLIELKGYEGFEGVSLVSIDIHQNGPFFINPSSGKVMKWNEIELVGGKMMINGLEAGSNHNLYLSGGGAPRNADYQIKTGESRFFTAGQLQGVLEYENKVYLGAYTGARVLIYDPNQPRIKEENPYLVGAILPYQDRPFALTAGEGKIYFGTTAVYGRLSGAIATYDVASGELTTDFAPVENHGIMGLTYHKGLLYASTTVYGGLGSKPIETNAKIFVYDPQKHEKLAEFTPHFKNAPHPLYIGGLGFDEKGRLWGASGLTLFEFDPQSGEVVRELNFGDYDYPPNVHQWRQTYIRLDGKGHLFVNLHGIRAVDIETMEYQTLTEIDTPLYTLATDGNLYYTYEDSGTLYQMEITAE